MIEAAEQRLRQQLPLSLVLAAQTLSVAPFRRVRQEPIVPLPDAFAGDAEAVRDLGKRDARLPQQRDQTRVRASAVAILEQRRGNGKVVDLLYVHGGFPEHT